MAIFFFVISGPLLHIAQKAPAFSFFSAPYDVAISQRTVHVVGVETIDFDTPFENSTTEHHQTMPQLGSADLTFNIL